jgi:hypothetical protein
MPQLQPIQMRTDRVPKEMLTLHTQLTNQIYKTQL